MGSTGAVPSSGGGAVRRSTGRRHAPLADTRLQQGVPFCRARACSGRVRRVGRGEQQDEQHNYESNARSGKAQKKAKQSD